jgi:hypothetical protein
VHHRTFVDVLHDLVGHDCSSSFFRAACVAT